MKCKFSQVGYYHRPNPLNPITERMEVVGIDTEADETGQPFMFALSIGDGEAYQMCDFLEVVFHRRFRGVRFVFYNMSYDEGHFLRVIPMEGLDELRETGRTYHEGYTYHSIPRKELRITKGKKTVSFYDIAQFYAPLNLDKAGQKYLGEGKIDIGSKTLTSHDVSTRWAELAAYCIQDARLTARLAEGFIDILIKELGIFPRKLYSCGYIAGLHFARACNIIDINRYWQHHRELVEYACAAYSGGKFEVYQRGYGYFYLYDINSAYPSEIRNLQDISEAKVIHSPKYHKKATYGFIKGVLNIGYNFSTVAVKNGKSTTNDYPNGYFTKTITKAEYEYIIEKGGEVKIIDAYWLYCPEVYPYREEVDRIYALKAELKVKGGDDMRYNLVKKLLNSFYGKFMQITEKHRVNGTPYYEAGYLFNPMYAAVITANTRIKICKTCDMHPENVVAVLTDCVITTRALHTNGLRLDKEMGGWDLQVEGDGVMVGSGVYQIGSLTHFQGCKAVDNLISIINAKPHKTKIEVPQTIVQVWRLSASQHKTTDEINRFVETHKVLDLHQDKGRIWNGKWKFKGGLVGSTALGFADPIEAGACGGLDNGVKV